jgi:HPr kinase/phosphorylase
LLRGRSGAGKSDLALRLIEGGADLVADDRVVLMQDGGRLLASPPPNLAGLIEARGLGILRLAHLDAVPLYLVVDLVAPDQVERLPEPQTVTLDGHVLRLLALAPFEASAPAKIRLALLAESSGRLSSMEYKGAP